MRSEIAGGVKPLAVSGSFSSGSINLPSFETRNVLVKSRQSATESESRSSGPTASIGRLLSSTGRLRGSVAVCADASRSAAWKVNIALTGLVNLISVLLLESVRLFFGFERGIGPHTFCEFCDLLHHRVHAPFHTC